tara:strand:- start:1860 stop:2048 length:189 start_codon:yes stop_codon:yes gene_type:complete
MKNIKIKIYSFALKKGRKYAIKRLVIYPAAYIIPTNDKGRIICSTNNLNFKKLLLILILFFY